MNEMRKLMETLARIDEDTGLQNQDIILGYDDKGIVGGSQNLDMSGIPQSLEKWEEVMTRSLAWSAGGYNDFKPSIVADVFREYADSRLTFTPARENSVALYIHQTDDADLRPLANFIAKNRKAMGRVDEINIYKDGYHDIPGPVIRLWWD